MSNAKIHKTQTGLASEFYVAAELTRRGYNVGMTFGNTKAIDIIIEKDEQTIAVQVKGIQSKKSITYNISHDKIMSKYLYVFVNLNVLDYSHPEFFILTADDINRLLRIAKSGRDWIDYNVMVREGFQNQWEKFENFVPTV